MKPKLYKTEYAEFYKLSEIKRFLSPKNWEEFSKWIENQPTLFLPNEDEIGVFRWDFEDWVENNLNSSN